MIYALGAFDGFHLGHRQLFAIASERARQSGASWGVMTFFGHPRMLFSKGKFKALFLERERDILAEYFDVPFLCKIPFDKALAAMSPNDFVDLIGTKYNVDGLVVGENFRFGRERAGDTNILSALCKERGWTFDVLQSYKIDSATISSSVIRKLIMNGRISEANDMLGHPYFVSGETIHGDARGRLLQYPTANITIEPHKLYPALGSYAATSFIEGKWFPVAVNIGHNPTFEGTRPLRCEAHVIGYSGDFYDKRLTVFLLAKNRDEIKFAGEAELAAQLRKDIINIRKISTGYISSQCDILKKFEPLL